MSLLLSSDYELTAEDIIAAQDTLEAEAADVLPFDTSVCTHQKGYIRQPLYACRTCVVGGQDPNGVCAACSVTCHADHELVELFARRNFRCDCGTLRCKDACSISSRKSVPVNDKNKTDHNFKGRFCTCGMQYDPEEEEDEMFQCLLCEDWLHSRCIRGPSASQNTSDAPAADGEKKDGLGPSMPFDEDSFDSLVCASCVLSPLGRRTVGRWAGREGSGFMVVLPGGEIRGQVKANDVDGGKEVQEEGALVKSEEESSKGKRKRNRSEEDPESAVDDETSSPIGKRSKLEDSAEAGTPSIPTKPSEAASTCGAPPEVNPLLDEELYAEGSKPIKWANVFLEDGWRERWCRCEKCLPDFKDLPFLLEEEDTFDPPDDPDSHKSLLELGTAALSKLPRDQAINGLLAFNQMRDRLLAVLHPLADSGQPVTKEFVEQFFAKEMEKQRRR